MSVRIIIFDTTLRDGEQSPGASMNLEEKIQVAKHLERMNVDVIEAGFPIASEGDFEAARASYQKFMTYAEASRDKKPSDTMALRDVSVACIAAGDLFTRTDDPAPK